jgi:hypothetical protein
MRKLRLAPACGESLVNESGMNELTFFFPNGIGACACVWNFFEFLEETSNSGELLQEENL